MTSRRPCPPAPGPLEDYATQVDPLLASVAQRRGFRDYLQSLLAPGDRNKTLTALADAEPITGTQHREVQRLQWFLSESAWHTNRSTSGGCGCRARTRPPPPTIGVRWCWTTPATAWTPPPPPHVARQYLGPVGKIDNGIVAVTSLWADRRVYAAGVLECRREVE
jgi:DDE superfamily endonuclease